MVKKILVIEDDPMLSKLLSYNLKQEGYEVTVVEHGGEGWKEASLKPYDMIILDLMLPGLSGFDILKNLRQSKNKAPVIILTARNAEEDIVRGLQEGADDYLTKPFSVAELLARISAVLRRTGGQDEQDTDDDSQEKIISIGNVRIYPERYEVRIDKQPIQLRPKEFELLLHFVHRPGFVFSRDDLMNAVWGTDFMGGQRTVDVHVSSLRKKLESAQDVLRIEPIRGVGYKLVVDS